MEQSDDGVDGDKRNNAQGSPNDVNNDDSNTADDNSNNGNGGSSRGSGSGSGSGGGDERGDDYVDLETIELLDTDDDVEELDNNLPSTPLSRSIETDSLLPPPSPLDETRLAAENKKYTEQVAGSRRASMPAAFGKFSQLSSSSSSSSSGGGGAARRSTVSEATHNRDAAPPPDESTSLLGRADNSSLDRRYSFSEIYEQVLFVLCRPNIDFFVFTTTLH